MREKIINYIRAGYSGIFIVSSEEARVGFPRRNLDIINLIYDGSRLFTNFRNGFRKMEKEIFSVGAPGDHGKYMGKFMELLRTAREEKLLELSSPVGRTAH